MCWPAELKSKTQGVPAPYGDYSAPYESVAQPLCKSKETWKHQRFSEFLSRYKDWRDPGIITVCSSDNIET